MGEREPKYRDFSEMPDDVLRAFANDLANPRKALDRIRLRKSVRVRDGEIVDRER